jgi:hypothetical protein
MCLQAWSFQSLAHSRCIPAARSYAAVPTCAPASATTQRQSTCRGCSAPTGATLTLPTLTHGPTQLCSAAGVMPVRCMTRADCTTTRRCFSSVFESAINGRSKAYCVTTLPFEPASVLLSAGSYGCTCKICCSYSTISGCFTLLCHAMNGCRPLLQQLLQARPQQVAAAAAGPVSPTRSRLHNR